MDGQKGGEMGKYYGSEALKNKKGTKEGYKLWTKKTNSNDRRNWRKSS